MILQVLTVARSTFVEAIRQPVFAVLLIGGGLALLLNTGIAAYTLEDDTKLLIDLGLSTIFIVGLLMCAFTATNVLSREIDNRTVLTIISKPLSRPTFILGKYFGVTAAIAVAFYILTLAFLLTVRHGVKQAEWQRYDIPVLLFGAGAALLPAFAAGLMNYLYRWVFTSTFTLFAIITFTSGWVLSLLIDRGWAFQHPLTDINPQLMVGLGMVLLALFVLTSIALLCSTRLGQLMTVLICTGVFLVGLVSEYFLGTLALEHPIFYPLYIAVPNLQLFWPADAITQGHPITLGYFATLAGYTAAMILAALGFAVALFQSRDVG